MLQRSICKLTAGKERFCPTFCVIVRFLRVWQHLPSNFLSTTLGEIQILPCHLNLFGFDSVLVFSADRTVDSVLFT